MQPKIMVTYTTNAGSTSEVAEAVAGELGCNGAEVVVRRMEQVDDLSSFTAVVVGGPMILGWHRGAVKFLKKHEKALSRIPVAYFFTAMSLTRTGESSLDGVPIQVDPTLTKDPKNQSRLSFRERYATLKRYLGPVLKKTPQIRPASAAFFAGKVDYTRLKLPQMLFIMLVIGAQPGDRRNWEAIRKWAAGLSATFSSNL